jgi:hypothetical protein
MAEALGCDGQEVHRNKFFLQSVGNRYQANEPHIAPRMNYEHYEANPPVPTGPRNFRSFGGTAASQPPTGPRAHHSFSRTTAQASEGHGPSQEPKRATQEQIVTVRVEHVFQGSVNTAAQGQQQGSARGRETKKAASPGQALTQTKNVLSTQPPKAAGSIKNPKTRVRYKPNINFNANLEKALTMSWPDPTPTLSGTDEASASSHKRKPSEVKTREDHKRRVQPAWSLDTSKDDSKTFLDSARSLGLVSNSGNDIFTTTFCIELTDYVRCLIKACS